MREKLPGNHRNGKNPKSNRISTRSKPHVLCNSLDLNEKNAISNKKKKTEIAVMNNRKRQCRTETTTERERESEREGELEETLTWRRENLGKWV